MASEIRNRFTDTEMQIARETDLPELLSHLGYQVKRVGRFHTTAEMDSLRIKDRRKWFRYSQNTGGDAITFLQQFCGKSFPEAVEYLLTFHGKARDAPIPQPKPISPKQEFSLPPRNADDRRVFAYLRKRGIPICPHLLFPPVADPDDPAQDEKARAMGLRLLESCQQMNVYGPVWTDGMWQEIYKAGELGIPVLTDQKTIGRTPPARRLGRKER